MVKMTNFMHILLSFLKIYMTLEKMSLTSHAGPSNFLFYMFLVHET
jgi:hypothetical protein